MGISSKVSGTWKPASFIDLFFIAAVSSCEFANDPACPNWTSVLNMLAQVPIAQATMGFVISPFLTASMTLYSSTPPTSPSSSKSLHSGSA